MNNYYKFEALKQELKNYFQNNSYVISPQKEIERDIWIRNIKTLAQIEGKSYTIYDFQKGQVIAHQSAKESLANKLNLSLSALRNGNYIWEMTHVDDRMFLLKLQIAAYRFLMLLSPRQQNEFVLVYQRRIMLNKVDFQCQIHKVNLILSDENDTPWLVMISSQPCKIFNAENDERYQLFSVHPGRQIHLFKKVWEFAVPHLTKKEKDILYFVDKGFTKAQIANIFEIEETTVRKHCANIHSKLYVNSINMACSLSEQLELR
jgi:DNA-binding CsgD family transcriptional regulator